MHRGPKTACPPMGQPSCTGRKRRSYRSATNCSATSIRRREEGRREAVGPGGGGRSHRPREGPHQEPTEWGLQVASAPPRRQGENVMADRTHVSIFERAEAPSRTEGGFAGSERRVPRSRARPGRQACGTTLSTVPFSCRPLSGAGTGDGPKTGPPDRGCPRTGPGTGSPYLGIPGLSFHRACI
jgi:hypothetical protein